MDPEIVGLASAGASALIVAMTEDGWERTKQVIAGLWRRSKSAQVAGIEADLDESRQEMLASPESEVRHEVESEWKTRLRRLIAADPEAASELREFLTSSGLGRRPVFGVTTHHGTGHINQAGRDIHVHAAAAQDQPTAERLAAMHPERAAQQLDALTAADAAWLLASLPSTVAAQVIPHVAPGRLEVIVPEMNPHRCADTLRSADPKLAGSLLGAVPSMVAIRILGAGQGAWPSETIRALGEGRAVAYALALGDAAAWVLEALPSATIASAVEGTDVATGAAALEHLSPKKSAQVLPAINRWQRATLASRMRSDLLEAVLSEMADLDAQLLAQDLEQGAAR